VAQSVVPCLILEKIIVDRMLLHINRLALMDVAQHGFTRGKSTLTQLIEVVHDWALYKNSGTDFSCVYFDMSKAFDRVDHGVLVYKMLRFGFEDRVVDWVISYLTSRSFRVRVNGSLSEPRACPSGVPQGSCLGPLLFCIFVNDIGSVIPRNVTYKLYADDLKMYSAIEDGSFTHLQQAVDAVSEWCQQNGMSLSIPKCVVVNSSDNVACTLQLRGESLTLLSSVKDLGVIMDPSLKFSEHVFQVFRSISTICNLIFRVFVIRRPDFYRQLYCSLIVPRLLYCSQVWSPRLVRDVSMIEKVRRRFERRVSLRCNVPRESFVLPSLRELHDSADQRLFNVMMSNGEVDRFFTLTPSVSGVGFNVNALQVARSEAVAGVFAWRYSRRVHAQGLIRS